MTGDVSTRFHIDDKREYVAGMSGGSRVALGIALSSPEIAGVFASSAGYPDNKVRKELPFPVFATAGTEDFNYLEMREMDRALGTPHHLAIFEGPHVWLPAEVATQAVEWMEIQAMKSGRKPRDKAEIDAIFSIRADQITESLAALKAIVDDFTGLEDVTRFTTRLAVVQGDKRIQAAIKNDQQSEDRERSHEPGNPGRRSAPFGP